MAQNSLLIVLLVLIVIFVVLGISFATSIRDSGSASRRRGLQFAAIVAACATIVVAVAVLVATLQ